MIFEYNEYNWAPDRKNKFHVSWIFAESWFVIQPTSDWLVIKPSGNIQKNYIFTANWILSRAQVCRHIYIITFLRNNFVDCSENNYQTRTNTVHGFVIGHYATVFSHEFRWSYETKKDNHWFIILHKFICISMSNFALMI